MHHSSPPVPTLRRTSPEVADQQGARIHLKFRLTFDGPGSGGVHQFRFASDERVHAEPKVEHIVLVHPLVELVMSWRRLASPSGQRTAALRLFAVDAFTRVISGPWYEVLRSSSTASSSPMSQAMASASTSTFETALAVALHVM